MTVLLPESGGGSLSTLPETTKMEAAGIETRARFPPTCVLVERLPRYGLVGVRSRGIFSATSRRFFGPLKISPSTRHSFPQNEEAAVSRVWKALRVRPKCIQVPVNLRRRNVDCATPARVATNNRPACCERTLAELRGDRFTLRIVRRRRFDVIPTAPISVAVMACRQHVSGAFAPISPSAGVKRVKVIPRATPE